jgi:hypothetical protein
VVQGAEVGGELRGSKQRHDEREKRLSQFLAPYVLCLARSHGNDSAKFPILISSNLNTGSRFELPGAVSMVEEIEMNLLMVVVLLLLARSLIACLFAFIFLWFTIVTTF